MVEKNKKTVILDGSKTKSHGNRPYEKSGRTETKPDQVWIILLQSMMVNSTTKRCVRHP